MSPSPDDEKAQQIITAASTILAQKGYSATTISQVAREAGVSRGLLHYYFENKEELLAQVVHHSATTSLILMGTLFEQNDSADDLAAALTNTIRYIRKLAPDFFYLFYESWAVARQSSAVAEELKVLFQSFRSAIREGLESAASRGVITPALPLDALAALLMGIIDGLVLQVLAEPELVKDQALWTATEQAIRVLLK